MKRYVDEDGTELVDEIMQPDGPRIFLSWITLIEVVSNLRRLERVDAKLTANEASHRIRLLLTEMSLANVYSCQVGPITTERARQLMAYVYLKPGDAIHLATAIRLQEQHAWLPLVFVTADQKLGKAAEDQFLYAYDVLRPIQPQIQAVDGKFLPRAPNLRYDA